jgi:putative endonuclease
MKTQSYIYIITNKINTVLYTGVTSNLKKRIYEHKEKLMDGFAKKYNLTKLVYFEVFETIGTAIEREKQIKNYSRKKKRVMITFFNNKWKDLWEDIIE